MSRRGSGSRKHGGGSEVGCVQAVMEAALSSQRSRVARALCSTATSPPAEAQEGGEGEAALGEVRRLRSWRGEAAPLASAPAHSRRQLAQKQSAASSSRHRSSSRASWVRT